MKVFRSKIILATGICVASMLGACQQENDGTPAPRPEAAASDQNARTAVAAGTLIKDGEVSLSYNGSNVLWKEIYPNAYSEFIYTPHLITAKGYKYNNYNSPSTEHKYTLDDFGRCVMSASNWETYIYKYDASGQLTSCYNKFKSKEGRIFTYAQDATGWKKSLSRVSFFDESGKKTKELLFGYDDITGVPDKNHLNPDVLPVGVSKYLPIFGNFNSNLIQIVVENKFLPNGKQMSSTKYVYNYTLDYAGKVKNVTIKKDNGKLVSSTDRKYSVPSYKF